MFPFEPRGENIVLYFFFIRCLAAPTSTTKLREENGLSRYAIISLLPNGAFRSAGAGVFCVECDLFVGVTIEPQVEGNSQGLSSLEWRC